MSDTQTTTTPETAPTTLPPTTCPLCHLSRARYATRAFLVAAGWDTATATDQARSDRAAV